MSPDGKIGDSRARGFTLVELIVCIVLTAIVAGFIVLFIDTPVQEYFQQTRRADLVDSADRIGNAVTADLRTALPNSLRGTASPNLVGLEFLQTSAAARYYGAGENQSGGEDLNVGVPAGSFGTVEAFNAFNPVPPGQRLSVGNLGTAGHDAYAAGSGTLTPMGTTVTISGPSGSLVPGENQVTLGSPMTFVPDGLPAPAHNSYLVSGPVSYVCDQTAGTLTRYSGYAVSPIQQLPPVFGATSALIAHDVSSCALSIFKDPSNPGYRFGQVAILSVTLSSQGETFRLFLEAPTEYAR